MATIYFTTNADSGDGSLRAACASAASGDTISPDPNVAWNTKTIEIALASRLTVNKALTFDGGAYRVRLNGQGACMCVNPGGYAIGFRKFDLVGGYNTSGGGCLHLSLSATNVTLEQCLLAGGYSGNYGGCVYLFSGTVVMRDCVVTGGRANNANGGGGVRVHSNARSFSATRCTLSGNLGNDLSASSSDSDNIELVDTIVSSGRGSTTQTRAANAGFAAPPPSSIAADDWTCELWTSFDLRLAPNSPLLTGAQSVGEDGANVDLLGNPRRREGAIGAYEGSWLVVKSGETKTLNESVTVDRVELGSGSAVAIEGTDGADVVLTVALGGEASNAAFTSQSRGYLAANTSLDLGSASFEGVVLQRLGARIVSFGATAVSPTLTSLEWDVPDPTQSVLLERQVGNAWETLCVGASGGSYETAARSGRTRYRAFDGFAFHYDDAWTFSGVQFKAVYLCASAEAAAKNWEAIVQTVGSTAQISPGQSVTILARIYDAFDADAALLNDGNNITSVKYSCYYRSNGLFDETETPVEGHENVDAGTECVLEAPQTSDAWTIDDAGYNFVLTPNTSVHELFTRPGCYRIKTTIRLAEGNPIVFYAPIEVVDRE